MKPRSGLPLANIVQEWSIFQWAKLLIFFANALDSDKVHRALDESLGNNRIRFGSFNGKTPVSGHPIKQDANGKWKSNTHKRTELKETIILNLQTVTTMFLFLLVILGIYCETFLLH